MEQAEPLYRRALRVCEAASKVDYPAMHTSLTGLARLLHAGNPRGTPNRYRPHLVQTLTLTLTLNPDPNLNPNPNPNPNPKPYP